MPKQSDPSVDKGIASKVRDEIGDACVNDWLEVAIVITLLISMSGGAYMLYLLYQLNQVSG
jgi:ABC-type enterochelin transport system permease subunit